MIAADTPEQQAACALFEREVVTLRAALKGAGRNRPDMTELVILLLLLDLNEGDRWRVFSGITDTLDPPKAH
jgi:hypothetical protein